jgi:SRSO17 transposase
MDHQEIWLLVEWPEKSAEPTRYFLCDLPAHYSVRRLVQVATSRWKIEQDYQQPKEELGLDHYEGRSWNGWHHHVTLVMLAHGFLTLETLRNKKTSGWTLPRTRREIQRLLCTRTGSCCYCNKPVRAP